MPNGSTSNRNDSIHPSKPNFEAAYAEQNSCPTIPAVEEIVTTCPERCFRISGASRRKGKFRRRTARAPPFGLARLIRQLREPRNRGGAAADAELPIRLLEVLCDRRRRDPKPARDVGVAETFGDEFEHRALAWCQGCVGRNLLAKSQHRIAYCLDGQDGTVPALVVAVSGARTCQPIAEAAR